MSKIYKKYLEIKSSSDYEKNTLLLFRSGLFFIFIDEDAKLVSKLLNLKLSSLNNYIVKCGFPSNSLQKYLKLLQVTPYKVKIVSFETDKPLIPSNYINNEKIKSIVQEILTTNINNLSISQIYDFLSNIQNELLTINFLLLKMVLN